jgi:hypothetical protein
MQIQLQWTWTRAVHTVKLGTSVSGRSPAVRTDALFKRGLRLRPGIETAPMHKPNHATALLAHALSGPAFSRGRPDALRMSEPRTASSVCGVTSLFGVRDVLFNADGGNDGGGGDDKRFSQADLEKILGERLGKEKEKVKALEAQVAKLAEIEKRLADADEREKTAREEAELKGKTELEKLQIQLQKSTEKSKAAESEWTKRLAELESEKQAAQSKHVDYVKRHLITSALHGAGIAKGADKAATLAFLAEAQLKLDENLEIKQVAVGGKSFQKLGEAAGAFLKENPFFAGNAGGGSGTPRNPNGGGAPALDQHGSIESLIGSGLAEAGRSSQA